MRLGVLLVTVSLAGGMAGPPGAPRVRAGPDAVQTAKPVLRSGVDLVEVAVLVRDGDDHLVGDLTAADFQVLEGGTPQAIAAFQRVSMPVRVMAATPGTGAVVANDVASNERTGDSRVFILGTRRHAHRLAEDARRPRLREAVHRAPHGPG